jgi:hypothetical protein
MAAASTWAAARLLLARALAWALVRTHPDQATTVEPQRGQLVSTPLSIDWQPGDMLLLLSDRRWPAENRQRLTHDVTAALTGAAAVLVLDDGLQPVHVRRNQSTVCLAGTLATATEVAP